MAIIRKTLEQVLAMPINHAELERINAITDDEIDFSDMPPLTQADWDKAMTPAQFRKYRDKLKSHDEIG